MSLVTSRVFIMNENGRCKAVINVVCSLGGATLNCQKYVDTSGYIHLCTFGLQLFFMIWAPYTQ